MLRCPQCEFKNPRVNKFCQNCGVSLTHKACRQCQRQIPIAAEVCSFCNADNCTLLWAIILPQEPVNLARIDSDRQLATGNLSDLFVRHRDRPSFLLLSNPQDTGDRYHLKHDSDAEPLLDIVERNSNQILQAKVVDCYPLGKTYLASVRDRQASLFAKLSLDRANQNHDSMRKFDAAGLPVHALPYLVLKKYSPIIPQIYDAWQRQELGVVLLPDRSRWEQVSEFWSRSPLSLSQIAWFLDVMAKLWQPLESVGCLTSLAIASNLRIDEDESFCLQQLYPDFECPPTLKDLAQTWQFCFAEANLSNVDRLQQLLDKIFAEKITQIEHLRRELQNLGIDESEYTPDLNPDLSNMSISPSEPEITPSEFDSATFESEFFDEVDDMDYTSEFDDEATAMIPMQIASLTDACCTDIGARRDHNEDFFGVKTQTRKTENNTESILSVRGLYLVCDGMGGHAAGEVASAMAVEHLQTYFQTYWQAELPDHKAIERGILLANEAIYRTNIHNSRTGSGRMGTTLVMALLQETQLAIAHVGDSRIYRLSRKQGLEQLTQDHEVGQREINRGLEPEIAYGRPDAYQLTQALGPRENDYVRPEIQFLEITEDCLILLCSDGLSDNEFIEQNWSEHLEPLISSGSDLQDGLFKFIDLANQHNGHDNITAVLLKIKLKPDL